MVASASPQEFLCVPLGPPRSSVAAGAGLEPGAPRKTTLAQHVLRNCTRDGSGCYTCYTCYTRKKYGATAESLPLLVPPLPRRHGRRIAPEPALRGPRLGFQLCQQRVLGDILAIPPCQAGAH